MSDAPEDSRTPSVRQVIADELANVVIDTGSYGRGQGDVELSVPTEDDPRRHYVTRFRTADGGQAQVKVYGDDFIQVLATFADGTPFDAIYKSQGNATQAIRALATTDGRTDLYLIPTRAPKSPL